MHIEKWPEKSDLDRALKSPTEELREYLSVAEQHASDFEFSPGYRAAWAHHAEECRRKLIHRAKVAGGRVGGKSKSELKSAASKVNVTKAHAAHKRRYPPCSGYKNRSHRFNPQGICYSPVCRYNRNVEEARQRDYD